MQINFYAIPQFLSSLLVFSIGFIILSKDAKSSVNRSFFFLCLSTGIWLSFYSINYFLSPVERPIIDIIFRIAYCSVVFISVFFFHFFIIFYNLSNSRAWRMINFLNYAYGVVSGFLILKTNLIVNGLNKFFWGYYPKAGEWHPYVLGYFIFLVSLSTITMLIITISPTTPSKLKNQDKYILLSMSIFSLACYDFIPNYGIEIFPIGFIPSTVFISIIAYAIFKYQLFGIEVAIRRGLIYSVMIGIISIFYLITVFMTEKLLQGAIGYQSLLISVGMAFVLGVIFIPLRNHIQRIFDKIFFKATPEEIFRQNELFRKEMIELGKYKTLATLSSGVAHEIKNPLTAIKTFAEFLPKKLEDKDFLNRFSKIVGYEVDRINDFVHQLLEYSKPIPLSKKETDIHKLIHDTADFLSSKMISLKVDFVSNFEADNNIKLNIDPNQIRQALLNIFLNAIEAMPYGGKLIVRTEIKKTKKERSKEAKKQNPATSLPLPPSASFIISIRDHGLGISPHNLSFIFEPFFSKKEFGTGLGLTVTKSIIENHGGKISVKSEVNVGTEFVLEIPLKAEGVS